MDVLRPELVWVDGRCYRKNPSKNNYGLNRSTVTSDPTSTRPPPGFASHVVGATASSNTSCTSYPPLKPYEEDDDYCDPDAPDDSEISDKMVIEKLESGGFKTRCDDIPSGLFSIIVGAKGATKKRLEAETQTKIIIPPVNQKGDIVIRGQHKKDVIAARRRIDFLASKARFQRDPTHFVCFPIYAATVQANAKKFQELVAEEYSSSPIASSISKMFQDPQKLHFTICVLVLFDNKERQLVSDLLNNMKPSITERFGKAISEGKCKLHLKGIEIMNDDPAQVDVLYAKCNTDSQLIQDLADLVNEKFIESGLAKAIKLKTVKLHVTLMNSRFAATIEEGSNDKSSPKRKSFDARPLLESEKYRNFNFGIVEPKEIHISVRYTSNPKDGFYNSSAKISLC